MKPTPKRACPLPGWAYFLALLVAELAAWVWFARSGVVNGWWSDVAGGLLVIACPLLLRVVLVSIAYRISRVKGIALSDMQRLGGHAWWKFFLIEYWHFTKQSLLHLPFPVFFRSSADRGYVAATGRALVLQHGYLHNGAVWHPLTCALEAQGFRVFTIDQPLYAPIDVMADRLAARINEAIARTGENQVTLIAHSMGGLIARAYLRRFGEGRVAQLITLGTPHHGTFHAYLAQGTNGREMRPGNAWLTALGQCKVAIQFTSIYSTYDTIISPQDSSRMDEANNIELTGIGHVSMFADPQVRTHVLKALAAS